MSFVDPDDPVIPTPSGDPRLTEDAVKLAGRTVIFAFALFPFLGAELLSQQASDLPGGPWRDTAEAVTRTWEDEARVHGFKLYFDALRHGRDAVVEARWETLGETKSASPAGEEPPADGPVVLPLRGTMAPAEPR